jgi:hypothetical protein
LEQIKGEEQVKSDKVRVKYKCGSIKTPAEVKVASAGVSYFCPMKTTCYVVVMI